MTKAQKMLQEIAPAIREIFWLAVVWNDHNFSETDIRKKAESIAKQLGVERFKDGVEAANDWLDQAEKACHKFNSPDTPSPPQ